MKKFDWLGLLKAALRRPSSLPSRKRRRPVPVVPAQMLEPRQVMSGTPLTVQISGPSSIPEGQSALFTATATGGDPWTMYQYAWDTNNDGLYQENFGQQSITLGPAADNGPLTVRVQVSDMMMMSPPAFAQQTLTVTNVAPTITSFMVMPPGMGMTLVSLSANFSDPGLSDTQTYTVDWGDNSQSTGPTQWGGLNASHNYTQSGTFTVSLRVTDDDGGISTPATTTLTIAGPPAPPTLPAQISISQVTAATETGTPGHITLVRTGDLSQSLMVSYMTPLGGTALSGIDYGSAPLTGSVVFNPWAATATLDLLPIFDQIMEGDETAVFNFSPSGPGYTFSGTTTAVVNITDAPLPDVTFTFSGTSATTESQAYHLQVTASSAVDQWNVDWGDGQTSTYWQSGTILLQPHTYQDDGDRTIHVTGYRMGTPFTASTSVKVENANPVFSGQTLPDEVLPGQQVSLFSSVSDAGMSDILSYVINWGDSSSPQAGNGLPNSGFVTGAHAYQTAGTYTVSLTAQDDDGGSASWTKSIVVQPITLTGNAADSVVEGQTYAVTVNASAPIQEWEARWSDGTVDHLLAGGTSIYANHMFGNETKASVQVTGFIGGTIIGQGQRA